MLCDFIDAHREEIIARTQTQVGKRFAPRPTKSELQQGVPLFLTQLGAILRFELTHEGRDPEVGGGVATMGESATSHGADLLQQGFTIAQVVHDYGDICQAITEVVIEHDAAISADDFRTLNRCLDDAIASAVTEYGRRHQQNETERQGFLAHELGNSLSAALLSLQSIKSGKVGVTGSTMDLLHRSLLRIRALLDRAMSESRLASGILHKERLRLAEVVEEVEIGAQLDAKERRIRLSIHPVDYDLFVQTDRQALTSVVLNVLQNALRCSRPDGNVWLRTRSTGTRVDIEIEDECGGLAPWTSDSLFGQPAKPTDDLDGVATGLASNRKTMRATGGDISAQDLPGRGCIFKVELQAG